MSVDYKQLQEMVKEAMFTGGGINQPSAPKGVPHRMPSADAGDKQQNLGDPKANALYSLAVKARASVEKLIEGLDEPIYDAAYEHAFKASACLRRTLNTLEQSGAHPMPDERVVAPPRNQQRWGGYVPYQGALEYGANSVAAGMMEEEDPAMKGFGVGSASVSAQAKAERERAGAITQGDVLKGVTPQERQILMQVEKILIQVADETDLIKLRPVLQTFLKQFLKKATAGKPTK
tara:strand:- start:1549 stop:2250 length:702 start_codon:yes stop_codon:yes gene_type:complete